MALFQNPCPEEVDVFSGPHLRMKQLVYEAFEKVKRSKTSHGLLLKIYKVLFNELVYYRA